MPPDTTTATDAPLDNPPDTSAAARVLNVLASPGEVFDEIARSENNWLNWLVPTVLVCLAGFLAVGIYPGNAKAVTSANLPSSGSLQVALCSSALAGSLWSALVLWIIGRWLLQSRFTFWKSMEIAGMAQVILALGTVVTALLAAGSPGHPQPPDLAFLLKGSPNIPSILPFVETMNLFHLWSTSLLALGLSRVIRTPFKECAFWVFGYWIGMRWAVAILS